MTLDRRGLLATGLLLALGGCASQGGVRLIAEAAGPGELETLDAAIAQAEGLTLRVASYGCTTKADFTFYIDRAGREPAIAFARRRLDVCRAAPGVVTLRFDYGELGLSRGGAVRLLNPVAAGGR
ncbi:hypothetical protein BH10PSE4_BH10PSE4_07580 [soil metagenome]